MKLKTNWRSIVRRAWSIRLMALAGILTGAEAVLPSLTDVLPGGRVLWSVITFAVIAAAFVARIIVQRIEGEHEE